MVDLIVIGAGWAGYSAALKARSLGLSVTLIEEDRIGGTCLNKGCIPTKALVRSARLFDSVRKAKAFGVDVPAVALDFKQVQARKSRIVSGLAASLERQLSGVTVLKGTAVLAAPGLVRAGDSELRATNILVACGSRPQPLAGFDFDGITVISSDEALELSEPPARLLIIGGGVIGCEFASIFSSFGSQVTLVEALPQLLPGFDVDVASKLLAVFKKRRIDVRLSADARSIERAGFDKVLVCIGRKPRLECAGESGLTVDTRGIAIDEYMRTNIPSLYAAGDCTGRLMLAHFAQAQGVAAVENMAAAKPVRSLDSNLVPGCVYTSPEIARVGLTEEQARASGQTVEVRRFDLLGCGMARVMDEAEGFVKIIADAKTGRVLGASIIGPEATELIGIMAVAASAAMTISGLRRVIMAHPTLSEALSEAWHSD